MSRELDLIDQARQGDQQAFSELVCSYRLGVINVVYRMCGDAALAEDAAQTAFLHAWQHLPHFQPRAPLRSWLYRIAVNAALDLLRRQRPTVKLDDQHAAGETVEAQFELQERQQRVRQAVLGLPPASRAVLVLREYEGLSYREIAETLEIPAGTVMSRLSYARRRLAEQLSPYLEA